MTSFTRIQFTFLFHFVLLYHFTMDLANKCPGPFEHFFVNVNMDQSIN